MYGKRVEARWPRFCVDPKFGTSVPSYDIVFGLGKIVRMRTYFHTFVKSFDHYYKVIKSFL